MQNREIASSLGVHTRQVDATPFAIVSGLADVAGGAVALLGRVGPALGTYYIVDAFIVVVLGGAGHIVGATVAAFAVGGLNMAFELGSTARLGKVAVLIVVIAFLQLRPAGLIVRRTRMMATPDDAASRLLPAPIGAAMVILLIAPLVFSDFCLGLLAKCLTYAIVAPGLDLLWGYTGMLSLGHGVFFGLGTYCAGMYLKLEATRETEEAMPAFMVWSGLKALPAFWKPFGSPVFAGVMAILVPATLASILGYLACRSRINDVYFSLITQAFALIIPILLIGKQGYTGGTNGAINFATL
ncbi:hypothetical protein LBMAG38_07540 [Chloroflexota bacterium]|nr:hypothetical protein LBMAG38_07540 [Chloroflexota bacterium]